jgi:predicted  nucleic acid-binding Zn-ribbon protein
MTDDAVPLTSDECMPIVSDAERTRGKPAPKKSRAPHQPRSRPAMTTAEIAATPKSVRRPRAPRKKAAANGAGPTPLTAPAISRGSSPEEVAALEASLVRLSESLQSARADANEFQRRQDELQSRLAALDERGRAFQECLAPAARSLEECERRAAALADVSPMRTAFDELTSEVERLARRMQEVRRHGEAAERSLQAAEERWTPLKTEWEAARPAVEAASQTIAEVGQRAETARAIVAEADRKLEELGREKAEMERALGWLRTERDALAQDVAALHDDAQRSIELFRSDLKDVRRHALTEIQSAVDQAKTGSGSSTTPGTPADPRGEFVHATLAKAPAPDEASLPEVQTLPADALSDDVQQQLLRYLNDARAVAQEQATLLQELLGDVHDAWSQVELQRAVAEADRRREALEDRIVALGGEPSGGRGLLSHVATYIWDVLQKPADADKDPIEDLLKSLCAAELEIGVYVALHALARAMGDQDTARLAVAHHAEVQGVASRLRAQITVPAIESAMRPVQA